MNIHRNRVLIIGSMSLLGDGTRLESVLED